MFVVGGSAPQDVSELYDPSTGSWSETDCCTDDPNRLGPFMTATLLPNGKVLVVGGFAHASGADKGIERTIVPTPAAALYDARTGHWTATGSMGVAREEFTAVLLPSGKSLVIGGSATTANSALDSAELFDPSRGSWTATASMIEGRFHQEAILLLDGRVLVVGGTSAFLDGVGFVPLPPPSCTTRPAAADAAQLIGSRPLNDHMRPLLQWIGTAYRIRCSWPQGTAVGMAMRLDAAQDGRRGAAIRGQLELLGVRNECPRPMSNRHG